MFTLYVYIYSRRASCILYICLYIQVRDFMYTLCVSIYRCGAGLHRVPGGGDAPADLAAVGRYVLYDADHSGHGHTGQS